MRYRWFRQARYGILHPMTKTTVSPPDLDQLDEHALRALVRQLMGNVEHLTKDVTYLGQDNQFKDAHIRKLTHEIAVFGQLYG
ncbi:MAG: hypothetical protein RBR37_03615 [Advenella sp.]|nr:hypothetical protein [Advenella sp.]